MRKNRTSLLGASGAFLALGLATLAASTDPARSRDPAGRSNDPLAAEIERWSAFLRNHPATDELWEQIKQSTQPVLAASEQALRDGRRLLALHGLVRARVNLAASAYVSERSADQRRDTAAFEAEWKRMGNVLREDLRAPSRDALAGVQPAAVRALGETALPQVRIYYDASLEYGRNTMADSGLFYLGAAKAQRDLASFCRTLSAPSSRPAPPLRSLSAELDGLEDELLAAYRPPASIDKHDEFIVASSTLKEARELDAAGLRYGALLRYLQAALRVAPLRPAPNPLEEAAIEKRLRELDVRLAEGTLDHSIGRLLLETAQADLAKTAPGNSSAAAAAIGADVLPRYFAALEPARPRPPSPAPRVTVTLVRWPYT